MPEPLDHETVPPNEPKPPAASPTFLREKIRREYPAGTVKRDAHPKATARAGEFTVDADLPPEYRVGVFREPRTYPAWLRFSTATARRGRHRKRRSRLGIKLVGVPGDKLLETNSMPRRRISCSSTRPFSSPRTRWNSSVCWKRSRPAGRARYGSSSHIGACCARCWGR